MTDARLEAMRELTSVLKEHADDTPGTVREAVERLIALLVAEDLDRRNQQSAEDRKAVDTQSTADTL